MIKRQSISRSFLEGKEILDIGCSFNPVSAFTIDIKRYKRPTVCASVLNLPFREKSFDCVHFTEVIEHIKPELQKNALKEIRRITRKNFVLSTPSLFPTWHLTWFIWENTIQKEYRHDHVGQIKTGNLVKLLEETGFKVKKIQRVMLYDVVIKCN